MKINKNKKSFFSKLFLNMDISAAITFSSSIFEMCKYEIHMEGNMSQNVDIGPSFYLRKCRN